VVYGELLRRASGRLLLQPENRCPSWWWPSIWYLVLTNRGPGSASTSWSAVFAPGAGAGPETDGGSPLGGGSGEPVRGAAAMVTPMVRARAGPQALSGRSRRCGASTLTVQPGEVHGDHRAPSGFRQSRPSCRCINHLEQISAGRPVGRRRGLVGYRQDGRRHPRNSGSGRWPRRRGGPSAWSSSASNLFPPHDRRGERGRGAGAGEEGGAGRRPTPPAPPAPGAGRPSPTSSTATPARAVGAGPAAAGGHRPGAGPWIPSLMLFDEPTQRPSTPSWSARGAGRPCADHLAASGMTMVVVTHEMGFAREGRPTHPRVHGRRRGGRGGASPGRCSPIPGSPPHPGPSLSKIL